MKKNFLILGLCVILTAGSHAVIFKNGNFLEFGVGVTGSFDTRIVDQSRQNRSNFVFENFSPGLTLQTYTGNVESILNLFTKVSLLYPLGYTFNDVEMKYTNMFNYMIDLSVGTSFDFKLFDILYLGVIPVLHYNFFWEDRFFYHNIGVGLGAQFRLATVKRQRVVLEYFFTYDFVDLGTNVLMEPLKVRFMHEIGLVYRF